MLNLGAVLIPGAIDMSIVTTAVLSIIHTVADFGWYSVAFRLCQCAFTFLYTKTKGGSHSVVWVIFTNQLLSIRSAPRLGHTSIESIGLTELVT